MPHSVAKQENKEGKKMVGNTLNVYQQTSEQTKCGPSPQRNTIRPLKSSEAVTRATTRLDLNKQDAL